MTRARTRQESRVWTAAEDRDCGDCGTTISAGTKITWGVKGTFAHPACAERAVRAVEVSPKAFDAALDNARQARAEIDALIERKNQMCRSRQRRQRDAT